MGKIGNGQIDFSTSVENEWLCSKILQFYGFKTAETKIGQFGDRKVLIVERFDRRLAKGKIGGSDFLRKISVRHWVFIPVINMNPTVDLESYR